MNRRTYLKGMLAIAGRQAAKTQAPKIRGKYRFVLTSELMDKNLGVLLYDIY